VNDSKVIIHDAGYNPRAHLVSGHCNHRFIAELQRFIFRKSGSCAYTCLFTPTSKNCCTGSYGTHFTFQMMQKPTGEDVLYLNGICDHPGIEIESLNK